MTNSQSGNTITFKPTTYNLVNGLNQDLVYHQKVFFNGFPVELNGIITVYDIPNDGIENAGPQQYLNIIINPYLINPDPNIPPVQNTPDAPYGLTDLVGSVYLYDVFEDDGNGNLVYDSSQGNTDPNAFPFLQQNYPELALEHPGYVALQGSGPNKLLGQEEANITQTTDSNGVIYITNIGTINITGGEGIFQGATGSLSYVENGISGLPYTGTITIEGDITLSEIGNLKNAYIIGQENFNSWSVGFDADGYLKVLPHPDQKVAYQDPFAQWQQDNKDYKNGIFKYQADDGSYYSSWGPKKELEVTLTMDELEQIAIDGFGILQQGDHLINWLEEVKATPYDFLRAYNNSITGPMLIAEPGDTLKITLVNNLEDVSNLHTHGLHVSPVGNGDNVLIPLQPGGSWEIEIAIPDDHFIGPDWYHPHLHGETNEQVASGLGGFLLINPSYDLPDLDKFDPVKNPAFFMAINSFGIQQEYRSGSPDDPLNQSTTGVVVPAGTPLSFTSSTTSQEKIYQLSEAPFVGYNAKPQLYNPQAPQGNPSSSNFSSAYGEGALAEPVENVIHTVNGQYNPTIETTTGAWNLFSFANMTVNSFHVIQLIKVEADGTLTPQEMVLTAIDGDAAGVVEGVRRDVTVSPVLNPGSRVTLQNWFEEPGTYYFISNATDEILGDDAPDITKDKGFKDGHLIWGSQVLATVEVTGDPVNTGAFPEPYDVLVEQSDEINAMVDAALAGDVTRERTFTWSANIGGAIAAGRTPDDTEVETFEGTYTINGKYWATEGGGMPPLTMPMLGTREIWNLRNTSGISDPTLASDLPLLEWHPFHIHQNDFVVLEINGIPVEQIEDNYLARVLSDTIALPPSYAPGSVTPQNPYGTPQMNGTPSEVKILMDFKDYPGTYVNHCHILFHEDAGMMAAVRVILNTNSTWLGLGQDNSGSVRLSLASDLDQTVKLNPYGDSFSGGVQVAIADINFKTNPPDNNNVSDNVTDIATVQKFLNSTSERFTVKIFDGKDPNSLLSEINPFQDFQAALQQGAAIASGDIDGDGFADIIVGIGGGIAPRIELYSGQTYQLMAKFNPFHHEGFTGLINLAAGDVNSDNFDDILVAQGDGGRGLVEIYSGIEFYNLIKSGEIKNLSPNGVAHETSLLTQEFRPYGDSYTGEVKITSGYILSRPEFPNGQPIQTSNANITTLATGDIPAGKESIQVWTYMGGGHSHDHGTETTSTTTAEVKFNIGFTPAQKVVDISGTFADIPNGLRGEPVLLAQMEDGSQELIHLTPDKGELETIAVPRNNSPTTTFNPAPGSNDLGSLIYDLQGVSGNATAKTDDAALQQTDAFFSNLVGLYEVLDATGSIADTLDFNPNSNVLRPGEAGYAQTAIANRINNFILQEGGKGQNTTASDFGDVFIQGGRLYSPFVIANGGNLIPNGGTINDGMNAFLQKNPNNTAATLENYTNVEVAYFTFGSANPDGTEHLKNWGDNTFGFEDLPGNLGISDFDFNDAVFKFSFSA
ncbi:MAG: multicopper oxidase domain-containing protein [Snowella sp.]|nr:multicopper oxidase domain-containing protein [Snowella sp.]